MLTVGLTLATASCTQTVATRRIGQLELPTPKSETNPVWAQQTVLLRTWQDSRSQDYAVLRSYASSWNYVEHSQAFLRGRGKDKTMYVGWLPIEMPYLLRTGLADGDVVVADSLAHGGAQVPADYVVEGRLLRSNYRLRMTTPLGLTSIIGVPVAVHRFDFSFEVAVYATSQPDTALFRKTYTFSDRRVAGLYYNLHSERKLAERALADTVANASADIVREVTMHRARSRRHEVESGANTHI